MNVAVNGSAKTLPPGVPLTRLIAEVVGAEPGPGVAVAVNGEVVRRADWPLLNLADGDTVEIVRATQGG